MLDLIPWPLISTVILKGALISARVLPLTLTVPFLGGEVAPNTFKVGTAVALTVLLYPLVATEPLPAAPLLFTALLFKEAMVGFVLAFIVNAVFEAARAAGTIADTAGGANMATALVPEIREQASLVANVYFQLAVVFFFALGGHRFFFASVFGSFLAVPLMHFPPLSNGWVPLLELVLRVMANLLRTAFMLSSPVVAAVFLTDLSLGLINRVSPTIQVYFLALPVKYTIGVILTLIGLNVLIFQLSEHMLDMLYQLKSAVQFLG